MKRRTNGFTLVETVMSITITAMVGLTVAGASVALSSAVSDSDDYFECIQGGRNAMRQLCAEVEKSRLVVVADNNGNRLVLWAGDANKNGQIDLTELRAVDYNPSTKTVKGYAVVYPSNWSDSLREAYDPDLSLAVAALPAVLDQWVVGNSYVQARTLATGVENLTFTLPSAGPASRLVRIRMSVQTGDREMTLQEAVALRAPATGYVTYSYYDGYVLNLPYSTSAQN